MLCDDSETAGAAEGMGMHRTGIEDYYIIKGSKKLRYGYTTGTCAAASAGAAALMLLSGQSISSYPLLTPGGIRLDLEILCTERGEGFVSCGVRKDSGDDPDSTDGILVCAKVTLSAEPGIRIDGGEGVGRVTRSGMAVAAGEAAINPVPREMIRRQVMQAASAHDYAGGFDVVIFVPGGREIAAKTFNPKLGIEGGISILGTSGVVVPMSEQALIDSIRLEMKMLAASGHSVLMVSPGNYGEKFAKEHLLADPAAFLKCSNFVGETVDMAPGFGIKGILFVAHIGKFIKVSGGIMNTHSKCSDARAELMAAFALRAGAERETAARILDTVTTEEALELMEAAGLKQKAMQLAADRAKYYLQQRCEGSMETEVILFSTGSGFLAQTDGAGRLLDAMR